MKYALLTAGLLLFALVAPAADTSISHDGASSPSASTQQGWMDLNKNGKRDAYENPSQPVEKRVADLLKRMTLDEKVGQLWQPNYDAVPDPDRVFARHLQRGEIGSFLAGSAVIETPAMRNKLQHIAVEQSRLGIPLIFGHDVIHGFRTVFPIPLAQACAWEPTLFERADTIAAREAAAAGIDWTFAPMVDLARDPRWGRIAEGFGEDPWLGALDAAASVRGFQGTNIADPDRVVACLKHYVGYGAAEGGRDYNTTEISEFTLRNYYLPQFKAGVEARGGDAFVADRDGTSRPSYAGAWTVMSSFNCLSGFPSSASRHTLTDILRGEWKFPGFVVSDWDAVGELIPQGVAADGAAATRLALNAGVDMEMVSSNYIETLAQQVRSGKIPESVLDEAVRRVLTVKFEKGLFDHPYTDESRWKTAFLRPDVLALAREAAAKSCVLLKNEGAALPLSKQTKNVALIGPLADDADDLVGCWSSRAHADDVVSLAAGVRAKLPADGALTVLRGCTITESGRARWHLADYSPIQEPAVGSNEIAEAAAAAGAADVVILALGEPREWSGEDSSRSSLDLPGRQLELFEAVAAAAANKPLIVVLFNGRPLALPRIREKASAILEAWFPGIRGGNGVADVLFGDVDPSGRLTTTFPRSIGQVPMYYNHLNTGRPDPGEYRGHYVDGPNSPLYPFGFGLTYTTFEYGKVELDAPVMKPGGTLTAHVRIKNTGSRAGTETVQLYIRDIVASAGPRPVRELKGWQKVQLPAGESRDVSFIISGRELGYYDTKGRWLVEPGKFQLWLAKDSASGQPADFELIR